MSQPASPAAQILRRNVPASHLTSIPEPLKEYFSARGKQVFLAYSSSQSLASARIYGRTPVLVDDLPDEVRKVSLPYFDPPGRNNGLLMRGDCCLMQQSTEERDAWRAEAEMRQAELMNDKNFYDFSEKLSDINSTMGIPEGVRVVADKFHPLSAHVQGGLDIAEGQAYESKFKQEYADLPKPGKK